MLLTTCPQCSAQFRVLTEQLSLRQGKVRCGRCQHVFNAFETLTRVEDHAMPAPQVSNPSDGQTTYATRVAADVQLATQGPVERSGSEHEPDNFNDRVQLNLDDLPSVPPEFGGNEAGEEDNAAERTESLRPAGDLRGWQDRTGAYQNTLLNQNGATARAPRRGLEISGMLLLMTLLIIQLTFQFRSQIVQDYPQLRPPLAQACELMGCTLSWGRDKNAILIESSDLIEPPGKPGEYFLSTVIANHGQAIQDLPLLDVRLTDSNNQSLLRRILPPTEYLGRPLKEDENLPPDGKIFINLSLSIDKKIAASGYVFDVLYQ